MTIRNLPIALFFITVFTPLYAGPNEDLMTAVKSGQLSAVQAAVKKGANVNTKYFQGLSVLNLAVESEHLPIIQYLVAKGANVNDYSLFYAVEKRNFPLVRYLVEKGADASIKREGNSILIPAVGHHKSDMAKYLFQKGAPTASDQNPVLNRAAVTGTVETLRFLLANKVPINARNKYGQTALYKAVALNRVDNVAFLLKAGADVNATSKMGVTPLMEAVRLFEPTITQMLVRHGANLNARDKCGRPALFWAAQAGNKGDIAFLKRKGAQIYTRDINGASIKGYKLLSLVESGKIADVRKFIKSVSQVDLNTHGLEGWTPLKMALDHNHTEIVQLLVEAGADVNLSTWYYSEAGEPLFERTPLLQLLNRSEPKSQPNIYLLKYLLAKGANVTQKNKAGQTALVFAASSGTLPAVKLLRESGADVNARTQDGNTPLASSLFYKINPEMVAYILEQGADVNYKDQGGQTALLVFVDQPFDSDYSPYFATTIKPKIKAARLLLKYGANINARDKQGQTGLIICAKEARPTIAKLLLQEGANVNLRDKNGKTALFYAMGNFLPPGTLDKPENASLRREVLEMLLKAGAQE